MTKSLQRTLLIFLAVIALPIGVWAYFAPRSWYDQFPGLGMHWLPPLGPYNEHFCSDVGAAYMALTLLAAVAAIYVDNATSVKVAAAAWLTFNVMHLIYHLRMLHVYDTRDARVKCRRSEPLSVDLCGAVDATPQDETPVM